LERFPNERVLNETAHTLEVHYGVAVLENREELYAYEGRCYVFLRHIAPQVLDAVTAVELPRDAGID